MTSTGDSDTISMTSTEVTVIESAETETQTMSTTNSDTTSITSTEVTVIGSAETETSSMSTATVITHGKLIKVQDAVMNIKNYIIKSVFFDVENIILVKHFL
jgi:hypothetical protein